ncbi:hypothetical protein [Thermocoleostomius sinensis]|uniref:Uncharacterized protein n=1 Tax=Thermocoleostomius sinensis A174 TaxID=2016057 RepID=A0A9E9C4D4_9CYAN|nr:hypothetical protein [Thermocoleostomius sinensis]WAL59926.1 hypothetical protein OXH18_22580 [Thermocoleostomius sinensis A174]
MLKNGDRSCISSRSTTLTTPPAPPATPEAHILACSAPRLTPLRRLTLGKQQVRLNARIGIKHPIRLPHDSILHILLPTVC